LRGRRSSLGNDMKEGRNTEIREDEERERERERKGVEKQERKKAHIHISMCWVYEGKFSSLALPVLLYGSET
jgi:hypothetical protein